MGQRTRIIATLVVLAVAGVAPGPAAAQTTGTDRQGEVQKELELARATDAKVDAEVARLEGAVARQRQALGSARQAEEVARTQVAAATRRLAETEERARQAKAELARRAVAAYVHPSNEAGIALFSEAGSFAELVQRRALQAVVQGRTADVIEELRSVREDRAIAVDELELARTAASRRAEVEASEAARLEAQQRSQRAAQAELDRRIANLEDEARHLADEAAELEQRIRQRSAPAAAPSPPAAAAPARSGSAGTAAFVWPVRGVVTSEYGPRWGSFHAGIDIGAPGGTPIAAAKGGVVISAGWLGDYGNLVVIDHGGGVTTAYAHQSRLAATEGERVGQGDIIGYVGSTGFSTGDHLHFEVRSVGSAQNPRTYLP